MRKKISITLVCVSLLAMFFSMSHAEDSNLLAVLSPYKKVLRKYTESGVQYSINDLDAKFKWFATYHSPEFLEAYRKQFFTFYPEGQEGLAQSFFEPLAAPSQTEFFIAFYAKARSLDRLRGRKNLWDLSLLANGKTYKPVAFQEVPRTAYHKTFYPYYTKWYRGYRVVFPYDAANDPHAQLKLQINSIGGQSQLVFNSAK